MIKALFDSIKERIRLLFASGKDSVWRKGWTNPRREPPPKVIVDQERRRKREWCRAFNIRQRWIVPEKSPESIYLKAIKPRKRRS